MNFFVLDKNGYITLRPTQVPDLASAFEASVLYEEGKPLLENLAVLAPGGDGKLARAEAGADAFSDRFYGFDPSGFPSALTGLSYVLDNIEGSDVTVSQSGYVIMLAPNSGYSSLVYQIKAGGWTRMKRVQRSRRQLLAEVHLPSLPTTM